MQFSRRFLTGVSAAAILLLGPPQAFAQEEGRIQGRVFIEGTREPVAGAFVRADPPLFGPDGDRLTLAEPLETATDDGGPLRADVDAERHLEHDGRGRGLRGRLAAHRGDAAPVERVHPDQDAAVHTADRVLHGPLKVDAEEKVEAVLADLDVEDLEIEQATAELTAADAAYNRQDYRTAIDGYARLLARWPQMTTLHQDVGDAHRALAQFDEAIAAYERYRAAAPDDGAIERKIARAQLLMGDLAAARDLAAAGGDASPEDLYNLARWRSARVTSPPPPAGMRSRPPPIRHGRPPSSSSAWWP